MKTFYEDFRYSYSIEKGENLTFPPHLHKHLELFYICDGEMAVTVSGNTLRLKAGEAALAFPNEIHSYYTPKHSAYYMLLFTAECAPDYADILIRFRPKWPFLSREAVSPYAVSSLEALLADYPHLNLRLAKAYISVLVGNIIERFELEEVSRAADLSLPQRALIYLENNFQEPFTMDAMARSLGVSKEHLSRLFSKKIGVPFHRYVHSLRMEHAKKLLLTTGKSVTEIAYSCGFDCQRSFNRIFRDTFHLTPREYRAQQGALVPKEAKNAPNAVESPGGPAVQNPPS